MRELWAGVGTMAVDMQQHKLATAKEAAEEVGVVAGKRQQQQPAAHTQAAGLQQERLEAWASGLRRIQQELPSLVAWLPAR